MSDNYICLIPTDPWFVPSESSQQAVNELLQKFAPDADEIEITVSTSPRLIDAGANLNHVFCSLCQQDITEWWIEQMDMLSEQQASTLLVTTPCCDQTLVLNELKYDWPTGFARFSLDVLNPNLGLLSTKQMSELAKQLSCRLRQILVHI